MVGDISTPLTSSGEDYCLASTGIAIVVSMYVRICTVNHDKCHRTAVAPQSGDYVIGAPGGYFGSGALYSRAVNAPSDSFLREGARRLDATVEDVRSPDLSAYQGEHCGTHSVCRVICLSRRLQSHKW